VTWIYLLEVNPARKMKSKPPPPLVSQFFLAAVRTELQTQCALCSGGDVGTIYIKITVLMGVGDTTTPIADEEHSSNGPMRLYACHHYYS
jgi:hypothetical protein